MFQLLVNKKAIWSAAALALLFTALPVRASDWLSYQDSRQENAMQQSNVDKMAGRIDYLQTAKGLIRADIKNNMGETLGSVKELIIDDTRDILHYVVIESNGTFHPVPWSAFDVTHDSIVLNIDKSRFMDSPQTGSSYLEKLSSPDLRKDIRNFYAEQIAAMKITGANEKAAAGKMEEPVLRTYSDVVNLKVQNIQGENLAAVRTLVFDTHQGKIEYALVGFGGLLGIGEKTAAVPWTSLAIQPSGNVAYLDADRATLETAVVDERNLEKLTQSPFARSINESFGAKPYWETLGFVPPGERENPLAAWQTGSKYNAFFDPESITTIDGTIRSVGIFTPEWGAAAGLKLTVEIGEGEFVVVHCGPEQYAAQREINFKPGTYITVTGSKTQIGNDSVIMACEIKAGDKSLLLRNNLGEPSWNVEKMQREYRRTSEAEPVLHSQEWDQVELGY
jgi:sporulation protein YlmC with PRC-barrel domain